MPERNLGDQLALRTAERNCETLVRANEVLSRYLLGALLGTGDGGSAGEGGRRGGRGGAGRGGMKGGGDEGYKGGQEHAELYNEFVAPKVGPGSKVQRKPLWLFNDTGACVIRCGCAAVHGMWVR